MKVQVLVAAMNQTGHELINKMNIQTDVIVGNQCDHNSVELFEYNGNKCLYLNFQERGVGLNRNNALMRATGDICLLADDDMIYLDDYQQKVLQAFESCPKADVIVFNLLEPNSEKKRYVIPKCIRVNRTNFLRYGAARIAFRLKSVRENAIYFNQCFGGGTEHCAGEDNLFLSSCLDKGLRIYAYPEYIAELTEERPSTWNTGDVKRYLADKGFLFRVMSKRFAWLLCLQDAVRHHKTYKMSISSVLRIMKANQGMKSVCSTAVSEAE